jgi:glycosyltransferase involved in cell wall biosynthesis
MSNEQIRVLMITCEWPDTQNPYLVPFLVDQINSLRKAGVSIKIFSFRGSKNPANYIRAWSSVRKILKREQIDLIHAHFGQSGIIALPKLRPLIVTFHGSDVLGEYSPRGTYTLASHLLRVVSKFVAFFSDEVIVVSDTLREKLLKKRPCHVIPCGINIDIFRPMDKIEARNQLHFSLDKQLILFAGQSEFPVKRFDLAKTAVSLLRDSNIELLAVSNVPHNTMPLYMNACDALLMTSLHEGSPTIIKEALACNTPIVATDVGDVRERIGGVKGCIVCHDDQAKTIADALRQVLTDGPIDNGYIAAKSFELGVISQQIIAVYHQVLAKGKKLF